MGSLFSEQILIDTFYPCSLLDSEYLCTHRIWSLSSWSLCVVTVMQMNNDIQDTEDSLCVYVCTYACV